MTKEEKLQKLEEISTKIIELKKLGSTVNTKKSIQRLQQQFDKLTLK